VDEIKLEWKSDIFLIAPHVAIGFWAMCTDSLVAEIKIPCIFWQPGTRTVSVTSPMMPILCTMYFMGIMCVF